MVGVGVVWRLNRLKGTRMEDKRLSGVTVEIDPFRCRMWSLHDRLEEHIQESTCKAEIQSFQEHGQLLPVLGRRLRGDPQFDVELIYGARRLFVARTINKPLLVKLREMSDRDAIIAMDMENRQRKDISAYERGLSYARWLRTGKFQSQEELSQVLGVSASQVSRLLKLGRVPSVVIGAFSNALEIREEWGLELAQALDDPDKRDRIIRGARAVRKSTTPLPARDVYRRLMAASVTGRKPKRHSHDQVIKEDDGAPLFRIRHYRDAIALLLPIRRVSAEKLDVIQRALTQILRDEVESSYISAEVESGASPRPEIGRNNDAPNGALGTN